MGIRHVTCCADSDRRSPPLQSTCSLTRTVESSPCSFRNLASRSAPLVRSRKTCGEISMCYPALSLPKRALSLWCSSCRQYCAVIAALLCCLANASSVKFLRCMQCPPCMNSQHLGTQTCPEQHQEVEATLLSVVPWCWQPSRVPAFLFGTPALPVQLCA